MIGTALRLAGSAAAFAVGVATGRQHERTVAFGTAYWRARAEIALSLYDPDKLAEIQAQALARRRAEFRRRLVEECAARSGRALTPKPGGVHR